MIMICERWECGFENEAHIRQLSHAEHEFVQSRGAEPAREQLIRNRTHLLNGSIIGEAAMILRASSLVALSKPNGKPRLIAVGEAFKRIGKSDAMRQLL